MGKIVNKEYDSLDIGTLPVGGTHCAGNWRVIWGMLKEKHPEVKEIVLDEKEFIAFVEGMYKDIILSSVKEIVLDGVKIIRSNY